MRNTGSQPLVPGVDTQTYVPVPGIVAGATGVQAYSVGKTGAESGGQFETTGKHSVVRQDGTSGKGIAILLPRIGIIVSGRHHLAGQMERDMKPRDANWVFYQGPYTVDC